MLGFTQRTPFTELTTLHRKLDDLVEKVWGNITGSHFMTSWRNGHWYPALECFVKGDGLKVRVVLPDVDPKDVDISVVGNQLILKGERKALEGVKPEDYYFCEIPYGKFERILTLPTEVDAGQIQATYKNGMLEITLPGQGIVPKKIPVTAGMEEKALSA